MWMDRARAPSCDSDDPALTLLVCSRRQQSFRAPPYFDVVYSGFIPRWRMAARSWTAKHEWYISLSIGNWIMAHLHHTLCISMINTRICNWRHTTRSCSGKQLPWAVYTDGLCDAIPSRHLAPIRCTILRPVSYHGYDEENKQLCEAQWNVGMIELYRSRVWLCENGDATFFILQPKDIGVNEFSLKYSLTEPILRNPCNRAREISWAESIESCDYESFSLWIR